LSEERGEKMRAEGNEFSIPFSDSAAWAPCNINLMLPKKNFSLLSSDVDKLRMALFDKLGEEQVGK